MNNTNNIKVDFTTTDNVTVKLNQTDITNLFHVVNYNSLVWQRTTWFGHRIFKCPMDMWIYQEMLFELKPDFIIETGTLFGGSAWYYAHLFDIIGKGKVITIDIDKKPDQPQHPRIEYINGSSVDMKIFNKVKKMISGAKSVMVILDSDHSMKHVYEEMQLWNKLVTVGNYMIVEDSNINGHPVLPNFGPGPMEAIDKYFETEDDFIIDSDKEKFLLTQNPRGYLKKVK